MENATWSANPRFLLTNALVHYQVSPSSQHSLGKTLGETDKTNLKQETSII
jgi:hypothetical protein